MADSLTGLKSLGDGSMGRSASVIFRRGTDVGVGGIGKVGYGELLDHRTLGSVWVERLISQRTAEVLANMAERPPVSLWVLRRSHSLLVQLLHFLDWPGR